MTTLDLLEENYEFPCGCVDYHMADCPTLTGGSDMTRADWDVYYENRDIDDVDDWYD